MRTPQVHLFVYGTLRQGGGLDAWLASSIKEAHAATASGRLYSLGAFPCAMFDEEGTIVGDVYLVDLTDDVVRCIDMEINAGYELVEIEVMSQMYTTQAAPTIAWAFHYPDKSVMRTHVPHGDWFRYEREHPKRQGIGRLTY